MEGEIFFGIDPFMYFERLKNLTGMPDMTYDFRVEQILLETTPWLTRTDEEGRTVIERDEQNESFREVPETDAWRDDDGRAHYVLKCVPTDGRV